MYTKLGATAIMKFCDICGSNMTKSTTTGVIVFECICKNKVDGGPADTLMAEGFLQASGSYLKHEVFMDQSLYDPARNIVKAVCPNNCGMDILTTVRVGDTEDLMYLCECGLRTRATQGLVQITSDIFNETPLAAPPAPKQQK